MNKSQRIYFKSIDSDKNVKIRLEQDVDTIEFLSMNIRTEDAYQNFNADYGVLIGRVVANNGLGIPNAKISIFIPLDDADTTDGDIVSIYPYTTPRDKNNEGKRYNLLPRVSKIDPLTSQIKPKQPFGSFPIKEEIVTNPTLLSVYKKYYKYTAVTNDSGDYMMFGVPIGTQTVHMSVDITDIGEYSMNPASMVTNLGYSANLFTDNNTRIKPSRDLNDLPNIETQEIAVDIIPFWGDVENFEIGITRQDFRIRSVLQNTFVVFGSAFTDGDNIMWGENSNGGTRRISELFSIRNTDSNRRYAISMISKRTGKVKEKIYYYPPEISDSTIDNYNTDNYERDMKILDPSEYSVYKENGDFVFIINCNRKKMSTDEYGNKMDVPYDSSEGIFTEFRGFITLEITNDEIPMNFTGEIGNNTVLTPFRYKLKFPQYAFRNHMFTRPNESNVMGTLDTIAWRRQHYRFEANKFYSFAKFHGTTLNTDVADEKQDEDNGFFKNTTINYPQGNDPFCNVGIIATRNFNVYDPLQNEYRVLYDNNQYQFPYNSVAKYSESNYDEDIKVFGANWMNLTIYLPQVGYLSQGYSYVKNIRSADNFTQQHPNDNYDDYQNGYYFDDNTQEIAAYDRNTKFFARSDLNWTDIINVPIEDIKILANIENKGLTIGVNNTSGLTITNYRNGSRKNADWGLNYPPCPIEGGKINGNPNNAADPNTYIYKGFGNSNCINFLVYLGLVNT